jgi:hypothetical protein
MKTYKANKNGPMKFVMIGYLVMLVIIFFLIRRPSLKKHTCSFLLSSPLPWAMGFVPYLLSD